MQREVVQFSREQRNATIGECLVASEQRSQDIYMQFLFRSNVKEGGRGEKKRVLHQVQILKDPRSL